MILVLHFMVKAIFPKLYNHAIEKLWNSISYGVFCADKFKFVYLNNKIDDFSEFNAEFS